MDIAQIIVKKLQGKLSILEQGVFDRWMEESRENRKLYHRLCVLAQKGGDVSKINDLDDKAAWEKILRLSVRDKKKKSAPFVPPTFWKYAAVLLVALCLGIGVWDYNRPAENPVQTKNVITLQLNSGEVKVISPETMATITDAQGEVLGKQKNNQLDYSEASETEKLAYNVLTVPYGEKFTIILSDGTKVHLNAGSLLKYPVKFLKGQNRKVFLTGEGFFDVHKDKKHPFVVTSEEMAVRVLGTKFNISAYPEDRDVNTVLVEGSVRIYNAKEKYDENTAALLQPGYKADWDRFYKKADFEKVDTDIYTGWIDGKLVLKKMPFKNILLKLQRQYNVTIDNRYVKLDNQVFTATFDVETIQEVLKTFTEETPFEYQINGSHIVISAPNTNLKTSN